MVLQFIIVLLPNLINGQIAPKVAGPGLKQDPAKSHLNQNSGVCVVPRSINLGVTTTKLAVSYSFIFVFTVFLILFSLAAVDCKVSAWTDCDVCSSSCGFGQQTCNRDILTEASFGGQECPMILQSSRTCERRACGRFHLV